MNHKDFPVWADRLKPYYWRLRMNRSWNQALRRKLYRAIKAEKEKLFLQGIDKEEVRLFCRYLSNLDNKAAESRYLAYSKQLQLDLISAPS